MVMVVERVCRGERSETSRDDSIRGEVWRSEARRAENVTKRVEAMRGEARAVNEGARELWNRAHARVSAVLGLEAEGACVRWWCGSGVRI